jgi:uncharacterized membrane protein
MADLFKKYRFWQITILGILIILFLYKQYSLFYIVPLSIICFILEFFRISKLNYSEKRARIIELTILGIIMFGIYFYFCFKG